MKYIISFIIIAMLTLMPLGSGVFTQSASAAATFYSGHPTITILSVARDSSVTFYANNLPDDDVFRVRMGQMGTRAIGGTILGSFETGDGGRKKLTYNIPSKFHGDYRVAIRIESKTGSGFFAYNWFYNNTTKAGTSGKPGRKGYSGFPTMRILSAIRNTSVTVRFRNLPSNDEFRVLMGRYGTRGVNGIKVTSFDTGKGGNQTMTFSIPSELHGLNRIAIRIQSKTGSGYFAYNWFFNR